MEQNVVEEIRQIVQEYVRRLGEIEATCRELSEEEVEKLVREAYERASERLKKYLDDVELEVVEAYDAWRTFRVGVKEEGKVLKAVFVGALDDEVVEIWVDEHPNINPVLTPFTYSLASEIPWHMIRPVWFRNIYNIVTYLAWAELEGALKENIEDVEARVARELWIYDYQHVYRALKKTREKFSI